MTRAVLLMTPVVPLQFWHCIDSKSFWQKFGEFAAVLHGSRQLLRKNKPEKGGVDSYPKLWDSACSYEWKYSIQCYPANLMAAHSGIL